MMRLSNFRGTVASPGSPSRQLSGCTTTGVAVGPGPRSSDCNSTELVGFVPLPPGASKYSGGLHVLQAIDIMHTYSTAGRPVSVLPGG